MKKNKALRQTFGINEYGLIDFPGKISGVQVSRILYGDEMGCSRCFPHGFEVVNAKQRKFQRN
ncbi:phosphate ABC transporter substrate-binding protein [Chryseobacterium vaccae]|uniref:phosphate ABC transporter substrate-binding protein n=1 Tax=Chryseobacterium vaccae TaxID=2604424 RepID=UPI001295823C|nr:phosphate ABC transporter substrate-binding protein [Chryseobacterium vaccae]